MNYQHYTNLYNSLNSVARSTQAIPTTPKPAVATLTLSPTQPPRKIANDVEIGHVFKGIDGVIYLRAVDALVRLNTTEPRVSTRSMYPDHTFRQEVLEEYGPLTLKVS